MRIRKVHVSCSRFSAPNARVLRMENVVSTAQRLERQAALIAKFAHPVQQHRTVRIGSERRRLAA